MKGECMGCKTMLDPILLSSPAGAPWCGRCHRWWFGSREGVPFKESEYKTPTVTPAGNLLEQLAKVHKP